MEGIVFDVEWQIDEFALLQPIKARADGTGAVALHAEDDGDQLWNGLHNVQRFDWKRNEDVAMRNADQRAERADAVRVALLQHEGVARDKEALVGQDIDLQPIADVLFADVR